MTNENVEGTGPMRLITDGGGTICGVWVEEAQLTDSIKPRLRMFLAMVEASGDREIPVEVYEAAAGGELRVEKNAPSNGGGFFLVLQTSPGLVHAVMRGVEPKRWWQFWK